MAACQAGWQQAVHVHLHLTRQAHEIGLGGYGQGTAPVSLVRARAKAEVIREALADGVDPKAERVKKAVTTFGDVMEDTIAVKLKAFRNEKHKQQWGMTLRD